MSLSDQIAEAVAAAEFGKASARKRGRNPSYPYVPVIELPSERYGTSTRQTLARAFVTRDVAVAYAEAEIERAKEKLAADLADPRKRALREWHGLPGQLPR